MVIKIIRIIRFHGYPDIWDLYINFGQGHLVLGYLGLRHLRLDIMNFDIRDWDIREWDF